MADTKGADVKLNHAGTFQKWASEENVKEFEPKMKQMISDLDKDGVEVIGFKNRAKDAESLQKKMNEKWTDKTLDQVTDGIGARMVVLDQRQADLLVAKLPRMAGSMKVLEHQDTIDSPKAGYRAHNILMRTPGGFVAELQVKTHNQDLWSRFGHDRVYKNEAFKKDPEVQGYMTKVSDYLNEVDHGRVPAGPRPVAPEKVVKAGLEFPWKYARETPDAPAVDYKLPKTGAI
jgi:ppGpp synthetase/RelA/SpoT-type nucleotidyltranferase